MNQIIVVGAAVFAALFILTGAAGLLTGSVADLDGEKGNSAGVDGRVLLAGGRDGRGESFITAGEPGQRSQTIVATGGMIGTDARGSKVCSYQYRVLINGASKAEYNSPLYGEAHPSTKVEDVLQTHTFALLGPHTGVLRVELHAQLASAIILGRDYGRCGGWTRMGYDEAKLLDGAARMKLSAGQSDIFEEGQQVRLDLQTGEGRWYLNIFDGANQVRCDLKPTVRGMKPAGLADDVAEGRKVLVQDSRGQWVGVPKTGAPNAAPCSSTVYWDGKSSGTATFTIPAGAFRPGGQNIWRAVLRNAYTDHAVEQFVAIDKKILAPEPPLVNYTPETPKVGEQVLLTMTSRTNPLSQKAVSSFVVFVWYGNADLVPTDDCTCWIARNIPVPAVSAGAFGYTGTYPFIVNEPSIIKSRIYAVDADGRVGASSLVASDRAALSTSYGTEVNDNSRTTIVPEGATTPAGPQEPKDTFSTLTILILAAVALAGAWALWLHAPLAPQIKIGIIAVGGAVLVYVAMAGA